MQCQCPRQLSLTIRSRAWLLDTGGDLVQEPHRHRTADLSMVKLSAVRRPHRCAVGLVSLLRKVCCQPFVENSSCLALSTTCCKYQWSERGPLDFLNMLFIDAVLLLLMSTVAGCKLVRPVGWGAWVEDPYIKKCLLEPASPETSCTDVQFSHGQNFSCERLQRWLHSDITTYLLQ